MRFGQYPASSPTPGLNYAKILSTTVQPRIYANNGVAHVVDTILYSPDVCSMELQIFGQLSSFLDAAESTTVPDSSTFLSYSLDNELAQFTVFAVDDNAWAAWQARCLDLFRVTNVDCASVVNLVDFSEWVDIDAYITRLQVTIIRITLYENE